MPRIISESLDVVPAGVYPYRTWLVLGDGRRFIVQDFIQNEIGWELARNREHRDPMVRVFVSENGERFRYKFARGERRDLTGHEEAVARQLAKAITQVTARQWRSRKQPILYGAGSRRYLIDSEAWQWRIVDWDFSPLDMARLDRIVVNPEFRYFIRSGEPLVIRCFDLRGTREPDNGDVVERQLAKAQVFDYGEAWMKTR